MLAIGAVAAFASTNGSSSTMANHAGMQMAKTTTPTAVFAAATGLPTKTLVANLTEHIMQLKGQVDAYHAKDYTKAAALTRASYAHMFMLGDALSGAIAEKFPQKFA